MTRRWQDVKAELVASRRLDPDRLAKAKAEQDEFSATYSQYIDVLGITTESEEDEFNGRARVFSDEHDLSLDMAYRMAFLERRVEDLLDEISVLRSRPEPDTVPLDDAPHRQ